MEADPPLPGGLTTPWWKFWERDSDPSETLLPDGNAAFQTFCAQFGISELAVFPAA